MADLVKVSLVQGQRFRLNKGDEYTVYKPGINEMPVEHAKAMGVLHRVVKESKGGEVTRDPLVGAFDAKLTQSLYDGGITTMAQLKKASQDELQALGLGPAALTTIAKVLKGGN